MQSKIKSFWMIALSYGLQVSTPSPLKGRQNKNKLFSDFVLDNGGDVFLHLGKTMWKQVNASILMGSVSDYDIV